jgi:predicted glycosyltransferase
VAAVVVPFAAERETEQSLRAERLAARGAFQLVREFELSPERLAQAIDRVVSRAPAAIAFDTDGARRTAALIAGMIRLGPGVTKRALKSLALPCTIDMIRS